MQSRQLLPVLALAALPLAERAHAEPVPLEDFFRNPAFYDVQTSRDGRYLSTVTRTDSLPESRNIIVMEIGKWNEPRLVTGYQEEEIRWHTWLDDGRLVFKVDRAYEDPNKSSEYVGFFREQNQIELYERVERFLTQHMPAGPTSAEQLIDR